MFLLYIRLLLLQAVTGRLGTGTCCIWYVFTTFFWDSKGASDFPTVENDLRWTKSCFMRMNTDKIAAA